jgi:head-tail adaptor
MDILKPYSKHGRFDRKITIDQVTTVRDGGHVTESWTLYKNTRALIESYGGSEKGEAFRETGKETRTYIIREKSAPAVDFDMRIVDDLLVYDIESIEGVDRDRYLRIKVKSTGVRYPNTTTDTEHYELFPNPTGTTVDVTAFSLPDPGTVSATDISKRVHVYRNGAKLVYNQDWGFGIDVTGGNNRLTFSNGLAGTDLLEVYYFEYGS